MQVTRLGEGDAELAIVGGVHGDEPCGVEAIQRLLADDPPVRRPVKLIVANEEALARNVRFVDADLNRAFTDAPAEAHERGLAEALATAIQGTTTLSIHSTQSYHSPFAITSGMAPAVREVVPRLSVDAVVDAGPAVNGRIFEAAADIIEVEAGYQRSEAAAENAYRLTREFLTATGALPGDTMVRDLPLFDLGTPLEKPRASAYEVLVENFSRVRKGQPFARADGEALRAEEPFWPVLLSAEGYRDIFGYRSQRRGTLSRESQGTRSEG
ncbi:MAG: succinylglutamate desuccinylase/aspartoacylase family protein [Halodesulfurarchaeum sp.]